MERTGDQRLPEEGWHFMPRLAIGSSANHVIMNQSFGGLATDGALTPFEQTIASMTSAEHAGRDWVLCADATDFAIPVSGYTSDTCGCQEDASDWNATFTMEPAIAVAAQQTKRLRFVWGPVDAVRRAPVTIAQAVLTLDHATRGRFAFILAHGQQNHMRQYGIARAGAKDKFWDTVHIVRRLIDSTEPFSYHGRVWQMDRAALALRPYGDSAPAMYVAGGGAETLYLAGRLADGWVDCPPAMDDDDPEILRAKIRRIHQTAREFGRDPAEISISLQCGMVCSEDAGEVAQLMRHPFVLWSAACIYPTTSRVFAKWDLPHPYGYDYNYYRDSIPEWVTRKEFDRVVAQVPVEAVGHMLFTGSPEQVLARLEPYLELCQEIRLLNWGSICGPQFAAGTSAATERLVKMLREHTSG